VLGALHRLAGPPARLFACLCAASAVLLLAPPALAAPTASFTASPNPVETDQTVSFDAASSSAPGGSITKYEWDLDGDGSFETDTGTTPSASKAYSAAGTLPVSLRVTDDQGATAVATVNLTVTAPPVPSTVNAPPVPSTVNAPPVPSTANAPPVPSFVFLPETPLTDELVTFVSTSQDPDGRITGYEWDLDNDGQFDDATGPVASQRFASAGARTIGLRVVDDHGATATAFSSVDVRPRPAPPARFISPFPVVRLAGIVSSGGVRVQILSVRAPRKARILVRCRGRGCPVRTQRARGRSRGGVRFRRLERSFRAGSRIEVLVTQSGRIGKYTRFQIRRRRPPARLDLCLGPRGSKPRSCPSR
jgi:PKD repeat protein